MKYRTIFILILSISCGHQGINKKLSKEDWPVRHSWERREFVERKPIMPSQLLLQ